MNLIEKVRYTSAQAAEAKSTAESAATRVVQAATPIEKYIWKQYAHAAEEHLEATEYAAQAAIWRLENIKIKIMALFSE